LATDARKSLAELPQLLNVLLGRYEPGPATPLVRRELPEYGA